MPLFAPDLLRSGFRTFPRPRSAKGGQVSVLDGEDQSSKYSRYGCLSRFFQSGRLVVPVRFFIPQLFAGDPEPD